MIIIRVKEEKQPSDFDYVLSTLPELDELMKVIYKPIIGTYRIGLTLTILQDIKFLLNNKSRYSHLEITLTLPEQVYKKLTLAIPNLKEAVGGSMFDYLIEGIEKRNLLIDKKVLHSLYSSVGKSFDEIDDVLDMLKDKFGPFMSISIKDISKYVVLNTTVYPRTVLVSYINLYRFREQQLHKCLSDISPDIVIASMVKQVKKIHEQKVKYLESGIGTAFIKNLNTKNLNLMYRVLVTNKPYSLNDVTLLLEIYERGLDIL